MLTSKLTIIVQRVSHPYFSDPQKTAILKERNLSSLRGDCVHGEGMSRLLSKMTALGLLLASSSSQAISLDSTAILAGSIPLVGVLYAANIEDHEGLKQHLLGCATSAAVTFILREAINKDSPDLSSEHSMPSAHASVAFQGASFLQLRYGPSWGIPALIGATAIGFQRVNTDNADWQDVAVGSAIGMIFAYMHTTPLKDLRISPQVNKERRFLGLQFAYSLQ
jgi:hypothetical protein